MKSIITKLLMLTAVLSASTNIHAYDFKVDGIYYDLTDVPNSYCEVVAGDEKYTGTVKIPSSLIFNGRMLFVMSISADAFSYCDELISITISNYIKTIPSFLGCTNLKELIIENGGEPLGLSSNAFSDCPLETVHLGRNLAYSDESPFHNMRALTQLTIGNGVNNIADETFNGCTGLKELIFDYTNPEETLFLGNNGISGCFSDCPLETLHLDRRIDFEKPPFSGHSSPIEVTIGNHITEIRDKTFYNCDQLLYLTIGNKVERIGISAFEGCGRLYELTIPSSVTTIDESAFNGCQNVESVKIPNSVTLIGSSAFYGCENLQSITIPNSVKSIGSSAFYGCENLQSITIPNSVKSIGSSVFYGCENLQSITIPNSITSIEAETFNLCKSLESVTIPNSVTSIGESAFNGCANLKSIIIPERITSIGEYAFSGCTGLTEINSLNTVPPTISTTTFDSKNYLYATLNVPINSLRAYQIAESWGDFWNICGGLNSVEDDAVSITSKDGSIVVSGKGKAVAEVYNLSGQLVYNGTDTAIEVPSKGIYVVRISGKIYKIAVL